jgi:hypothetical protein
MEMADPSAQKGGQIADHISLPQALIISTGWDHPGFLNGGQTGGFFSGEPPAAF